MFRYCCSRVNVGLISRAGDFLGSWHALRQVASRVSFNQRVEFLGQILGVIAGSFERLCHQEDLEARRIPVADEMFLKQTMTDVVEFRINAQHLTGSFQIEMSEPVVNVFKHVMEDDGHLNKVAEVRGRNRMRFSVQAIRDAHHEVSDPLQVGNALEARQQLASPRFIHARDCSGQPLIDLALDLIEFLLAVADRQKGHARRIGQQIPDVEC